MKENSTGKRAWQIVRRVVLAFAILITLVAILYTEEDWRGKRAWDNYRREWEAKGERFDWQALVPPAVPDDQNFFTTAIVSNLLQGKTTMEVWRSDKSDPPSSRREGWTEATLMDLAAWQAYYRTPSQTNPVNEFPVASQPQTPAADVLLALSKYNVEIEALRTASQQPDLRLPVNYEDGFNAVPIRYYSLVKQCMQVLQLRAVAELADGQSSQALADVKLALRLNDAIVNPPFLVSHLVRIAIFSLLVQPIWEGLAEHRWSDGQLVALDVELGKLDFLRDYQLAMRGERAFAIQSLENQRLTRKMVTLLEGDGRAVTNSLYWLPAAYFYQNELAFARLDQQWLLPLVDTNLHEAPPDLMRRTDAAVRAAAKHYSLYRIQAVMTLSALDKAVSKFAFAQAEVDLARVACALERYRLAHGDYPQSLDALVPQFLQAVPPDVINGQPLHYRLTADGQFVLYSIGWNERDDGGKISTTSDGAFDRANSDWVWTYPAKEPAKGE